MSGRVRDVLLAPDTRANQPAASAVDVGALYCVTDESNVLERSNGATWDPYAPVASSAGRDPNDPVTSTYLKDDFQIGSGDGKEIGELRWTHTGSGVSKAYLASEADHPGIFEFAVVNNIAGLFYANAANLSACRFADDFDAYFILRLYATANLAIRFGLFEVSQTAVADPPNAGIYFEYLAAGDTNLYGVTRSASTQTRTDMTVAASTNFVRFRLRRIDGSTIGFTMDGGAEVPVTTNIPSGTGYAVVQVRSTSGANAADLDFHDLLVTGLAR
jgi:hypothetical protein